MGSLLNSAKNLDPKYIAEAEKVLQDAVKLAPTKQPVYFELAQFYLTVGQLDQAILVLQKAWDLDHSFAQPAANLWMVGVLAKRSDVVQKVQEKFKIDNLGEDNLYRIALSYQKVGDFPKALEVYQKLVALNPNSAQYRATLAALYAREGYKKEAEQEVKEAVRLDQTFQKEADLFLKMLKQGTLPQ